MRLFLRNWLRNPARLPLLKWIAGFFTAGTVITLLVALRYFGGYQFSDQPLGILYTITAVTSHFSSALLILALVPVALVTILIPSRRATFILSIFLMAFMLTLVLLDSQLFTAHRFHITLLTLRILGIQTWGFGLFYFILSTVFFSFLARIIWERNVVRGKKTYLFISVPIVVLATVFTHVAHIRADVTGYMPITRFTTTLPFFYPATDRSRMMKKGIDINNRRLGVSDLKNQTGFNYPKKPLTFTTSDSTLNLLLIMVDGMRFDVMTDSFAPNCMQFVRDHGARFTNHWSGGNSTRMGMFSLFYGIPPTYQPFVQANRISPVLVNRLLEQKFRMGIYSSYRLTIPAALDLTAFSRVPDLRCETTIPGPSDPWRKDSAITDQWKTWLENNDTTRPFFGFLFYDAMLKQMCPPSYKKRIAPPAGADKMQRQSAEYKGSMMYIDSLIGTVLDDLTARNLLEKTIVIITADHGLEFDDNHLGFSGHGSAYSDYQLRIPLLIAWPGRNTAETIDKRTSHYDICLTLMQDLLGCSNAREDYCSGINLFSREEWNWLVAGSYFNNAIVEPGQVTVQFPTGHFEVRDRNYKPIAAGSFSSAMSDAFSEMSRFFSR